MATHEGPEFYVAQKDKMLRKHRKLMRFAEPTVAARVGQAPAAKVIGDSARELEQIIPAIPYVGGKANTYTEILSSCATFLAFYRAMKRHGYPVETAGPLLKEVAQTWTGRYPKWIRNLVGRFFMSRLWRWLSARQARASQKRRWAGDFVFEIVDDPEGWGVDYHECGVVKFFQAQGASELVPYICALDFVLFPSLGVKLERQGTIGTGASRCDFRFRSGGAPETMEV